MITKRTGALMLFCVSMFALSGCVGGGDGAASGNTPSAGANNSVRLSEAQLGDKLFHEVNLSLSRTMSCATCHHPEHGFIDNRENDFQRAVSLGADGVKLGLRNTPTVTYAQFSPRFSYDAAKAEWYGGQFHDGRAQHLMAQVNLNGGPILNPVEMMMPNYQSVIDRLLENPEYIQAFKAEYGEDIFTRSSGGTNGGLPAFSRIGQAISIFEQTDEISPFDSKFDRFLQGEYVMNSEEAVGWQLVQNHCMGCHDSSDITGTLKQTFSNYRYYNLGVPVNQQVRQALGMTEKDPGLYGNPSVNDVNQSGKFKTPTLRNSAVTGPYMHNGVFKSLETVIAFKDFRRVANNNERVLNPESGLNWGETDYPERVQYSANEALSDEDIDAIVAFLKLLTDQRYELLIR